MTEPELEAWGRRIGENAEPPLVLALRGELGAGKSVLARAVARGAGVTSPMPSPTFNLLFSYSSPAGVTVHHLDLYRLENPADVWELGWAELGRAHEIVLVEWPERADSILPPDRWDVYLEHVEGRPDVRRVRAVRHGNAGDIPPPRS
ncbi:MAG TPA: tRNA (adenosine(37)-N6)-threonylcarbamoyltransferase complex ATPase subunit type 1 TsaE [Longimicrobiales bacterium]|nr:tRNA (adenosine(37)-N6)-threonylcarbamoyltransferase complex ATPase subunit type 1 TsaE [Longimicrobiales bacterium]